MHWEIDGDAVQHEEDIRRVIGGEPPDHRIGSEARPLPLLMDLDAAGPAKQIVGVVGEGPTQLRRRYLDRGHRWGGGLGPFGRDRDGFQLPGSLAGCRRRVGDLRRHGGCQQHETGEQVHAPP
jgi:hypothetical protein